MWKWSFIGQENAEPSSFSQLLTYALITSSDPVGDVIAFYFFSGSVFDVDYDLFFLGGPSTQSERCEGWDTNTGIAPTTDRTTRVACNECNICTNARAPVSFVPRDAAII